MIQTEAEAGKRGNRFLTCRHSKPRRLTHFLQAWAATNKITTVLRNVDSILWENKLRLELANLFLTEHFWQHY